MARVINKLAVATSPRPARQWRHTAQPLGLKQGDVVRSTEPLASWTQPHALFTIAVTTDTVL